MAPAAFGTSDLSKSSSSMILSGHSAIPFSSVSRFQPGPSIQDYSIVFHLVRIEPAYYLFFGILSLFIAGVFAVYLIREVKLAEDRRSPCHFPVSSSTDGYLAEKRPLRKISECDCELGEEDEDREPSKVGEVKVVEVGEDEDGAAGQSRAGLRKWSSMGLRGYLWEFVGSGNAARKPR